MIENEDDRSVARYVLDADHLHASEVDAHRETKNGNDNSASHLAVVGNAGDSTSKKHLAADSRG